jgi:hypothetical protein
MSPEPPPFCTRCGAHHASDTRHYGRLWRLLARLRHR